MVAGVAFVIGCGGGDDDTGSTDAVDTVELGEAVAEAGGSDSAESSADGGGQSTTTTTSSTGSSVETRELPDLPPPDVTGQASPPTTAPGTEQDVWPIGFPADEPGNSIPLIGDFVVDLEHHGYLDLPVHLEEGRVVAVISAGDDGIMTHIEIFRPDGASEGSWQGGEPGITNGWEWVGEDGRVPMTGTYVVRIVHLGGSDGPFLLRIFGEV